MYSPMDLLLDDVLILCKEQLSPRALFEPIVLVGDPGSGRTKMLQDILAGISDAAPYGDIPPIAVEAIVDSFGRVSLMPRISEGNSSFFGQASRWSLLVSSLFAVGATADNNMADLLASIAAILGASGAAFAVADGLVSGESDKATSDRPTATSPLGELIIEIKGLAKEGYPGLILVIEGAQYLSPIKLSILVEHFRLICRICEYPVAIVMASDSTQAAAINRASFGGKYLEREMPLLNSFDVQTGWGDCSLEFAEQVVDFTGGLAGLIATLRSVVHEWPSLRLTSSITKGQFLLWMRGHVQDVLESKLAECEIFDADRIRAATRALELISCLGGVATSASLLNISSLNTVVDDLRLVNRPGKLSTTAWHILNYTIENDIFSVSPLVSTTLRASAEHLRAPLYAKSHPMEMDEETKETWGYLESWVEDAHKISELLNTDAENFASSVGREDLSVRLRLLSAAANEQSQHSEADVTAKILKAVLHTADSNFLMLNGSHLHRLATTGYATESNQHIQIAADALRRARIQQPDSLILLMEALTSLRLLETPFLLTDELSELLIGHKTPITRRVLLDLCISNITESPWLSACAGIHAVGERLSDGSIDADRVSSSLWMLSLTLHYIANKLTGAQGEEAKKLNKLAGNLHHALACGETRDLSARASGYLAESLGLANMGVFDNYENPIRALASGWNYDETTYRSLYLLIMNIGHEVTINESRLRIFGIALLSKCEKFAPLEESAWWAFLAQVRARQGRDSEADMFFGMACTLAKALGAVEIPFVLKNRLEEKFYPRPVDVDIVVSNGQQSRMTGAFKDWILQMSFGSDRQSNVHEIKREITKAIERGALDSCDDHADQLVTLDLIRAFLFDAGKFFGTVPFDLDERNRILKALTIASI